MKIIVVGGGKVGFAIAAETTREGHDVTIIDNDRETVERLSAALDAMVLYGNGAALAVQKDAGVEDSDLLIAATAQDELNMICCILARKLGAPTPSPAFAIRNIMKSSTCCARNWLCP